MKSEFRPYRSLLVAAVTAALCLGCQKSTKEDRYHEAIEQSREYVQELRDRFQIPGISVAVGINDSILWSEGFGYANVQTRTPVTSKTMFRAGSVSKVLTAGALALLYEQRTIDLDAPVQKYVPEFPTKRFVITTRQLAGHIAGIRNYRIDEQEDKRHYDDVVSALELFQHDSLLHSPGQMYSYSSYGWVLISAIIQRASGRPFLSYIRENVFNVLGMEHTAPDDVTRDLPNRTTFYVGSEEVAPAIDVSYKWASGGFLSTAEDLVRYGSALLPGREFLKEETKELLFTNQKTSDGKEIMHGLGWVVQRFENGKPLYYHPGSMTGGQAILVIQPQDRIVVAMLANRAGGFGELAANQIACFFLGLEENDCPELAGEKKRKIEKFERYQMLNTAITEWKVAVEERDLKRLLTRISEHFRSTRWKDKSAVVEHFKKVFAEGETRVNIENLHLRFQTRGYPLGAMTYVEGITTSGAFGSYSVRLTFIREESGPLITDLETIQSKE